MLTHAFETWKRQPGRTADRQAERALAAAIVRIGAQPEGILRAHMTMPDGRIRDSAIYSITRPEWPGVQAALADRLRRA